MKTRGKLRNPDVGAEVMAAERREIYEGNCYGVCSADDFLSYMPAGPGSGAAVCKEYHGQKWIDNFRVFWYPDAKSTATFRISGLKRSVGFLLRDYDDCVLIQFWKPKRSCNGNTVLTVSEQSFTMGKLYNGLCKYRYRCVQQEIHAREACPIGRVFDRALPECFGTIDSCSIHRFPMKTYALDCGIRQYYARPVIKRGQCIGVLEILSATGTIFLHKDYLTLLKSTNFECTSLHEGEFDKVSQALAETSTKTRINTEPEDFPNENGEETKLADFPNDQPSISQQEMTETPREGFANNEVHLSLDMINQCCGSTKLIDAAENFGVPPSALRPRKWPSLKGNKFHQIQSSVNFVEVEEHSNNSEAPAVNVKGKSTAPRDDENGQSSSITVKAAYRNKFVKFSLSRVGDLRRQLKEKLKLEVERFEIKYEDEDGEWINWSCNEDFLFHVENLKASGKSKMKLYILTTVDVIVTLEMMVQQDHCCTTQRRDATEKLGGDNRKEDHLIQIIPLEDVVEASASHIPFEEQVEVGSRREVGLAAENLECEQALSHETLRVSRKEPPETLEANDQASSIIKESVFETHREYLGMTELADAADKIEGLGKQPFRKRKKVPNIDSCARLQKTKLVEVGECSSSGEAEAVEVIPENSKGKSVAPEDENGRFSRMNVKATYRNKCAKFPLCNNLGIEELRRQLEESLKLENEKFEIKYKDEDGECINLCCDKDLLFHVETLKASGKSTIKLEICTTEEAGTTLEKIMQYRGRTTQEFAAAKLNVSLNTLKRSCKTLGLGRWPSSKRKKVHDPPKSRERLQVTESSENAFQESENRQCSNNNPPENEAVTAKLIPVNTKGENGEIVVKATYDGDTAMFPLRYDSGFKELRQELDETFGFGSEKFKVKYKDGDGGWITLFRDKDLLFRIQTLKASGESTMELSVSLVS